MPTTVPLYTAFNGMFICAPGLSGRDENANRSTSSYDPREATIQQQGAYRLIIFATRKHYFRAVVDGYNASILYRPDNLDTDTSNFRLFAFDDIEDES